MMPSFVKLMRLATEPDKSLGIGPDNDWVLHPKTPTVFPLSPSSSLGSLQITWLFLDQSHLGPTTLVALPTFPHNCLRRVHLLVIPKSDYSVVC